MANGRLRTGRVNLQHDVLSVWVRARLLRRFRIFERPEPEQKRVTSHNRWRIWAASRRVVCCDSFAGDDNIKTPTNHDCRYHCDRPRRTHNRWTIRPQNNSDLIKIILWCYSNVASNIFWDVRLWPWFFSSSRPCQGFGKKNQSLLSILSTLLALSLRLMYLPIGCRM